MRQILLVLMTLFLVAACAAAPKSMDTSSKSVDSKPKWVDAPRQVLDHGDYIIGIGSGASYNFALINAQSDIAQQLSVRVESVVELKSTNIEAGGKEFYAESIEKNSKMTVDQMLRGLIVARQEEFKGKYWVMVTLNKTLMLNSLRGELDKLYASAEVFFDEGNKLAADGRILTAIKNYTDAQAILPEFYTKKTFYDNFAANPYPIPGKLSISTLEAVIRNMLTSVMFEVVSGANQAATKGSQLPETVVFRAIYRTRGGDKVPLGGFPVKVTYGDNTLIEKGVTDRSGTFQVNVIAIPQSGSRGKVIIRSDAFMLPAYMTKSAEQSVGEVTFNTTESDEIITQLIIKDSAGLKLDKVEKNVTQKLSSNNVRVSERAPLIMEGLVSITESKLIEGLGAKQTLVKVRLDLELKVQSTKEVLGTVSGTGQGMSERGEKDALSRAYDNINLNNRELVQMINSASSKISSALLRSKPVEEPKPIIKEEVVEAPISKTQTTKVEPTIMPAAKKDKHWFTSDYRIYSMEEFKNREHDLLAMRVGKLISETSTGLKKRANIQDLEKEITFPCDFYYETVPAEIHNIKAGDTVFVFHTRKAPDTEVAALSQTWEMLKVHNASDVLKGSIKLYWGQSVPLDAIRVLKK